LLNVPGKGAVFGSAVADPAVNHFDRRDEGAGTTWAEPATARHGLKEAAAGKPFNQRRAGPDGTTALFRISSPTPNRHLRDNA
jgi:hypothetical protein